jgi:preprotein translocase subunit Sss1
MMAELDEKIKNCDQLIQNYENPSKKEISKYFKIKFS